MKYLSLLILLINFSYAEEYQTIALDSDFVGENVDSDVRYLDDSERADFLVIFHKGKLYDAFGDVFNTLGYGTAIYVMDIKGRIFASKKRTFAFSHSSLAGGQPVVCAGTMVVHNGELQSLTDFSAAYPAGTSYPLDSVIQKLKGKKINLSEVKIGYSSGR